MLYYDVANLMTVIKMNMIDEMFCHYGTPRTTTIGIQHQVSHRAAQRTQLLYNLTILIVKSHTVLNTPPQLQVHSSAPWITVAESESTFRSSRGGCEHPKEFRGSSEGYRSDWEAFVWRPDQVTFC
jgi:hypothetical protein